MPLRRPDVFHAAVSGAAPHGATHMPIDAIGQLLRFELAFLTESLGVARPT